METRWLMDKAGVARSRRLLLVGALICSIAPATFGAAGAPQVQIDARWVVVERSSVQDLGNQLGITGNGLSVPGQAFVLTGTGSLDEVIKTAEGKGTARTLARPGITAENDRAATLSTRFQIPLQVNGPPNVDIVAFRSFNLTIRVTPRIAKSGMVELRVAIEDAASDASVRRFETSISIPDGETAGIGGFPLSNTFGFDTNFNKAQLLVFITPRMKIPPSEQ